MSTAAVKTERSENSPLSAEERPSQRPRTEGNDINHNDASSALITPARTTATGGGDSGTTATATTTQPSASVPVTQTQTERPTSSAFDNDLDDDVSHCFGDMEEDNQVEQNIILENLIYL